MSRVFTMLLAGYNEATTDRQIAVAAATAYGRTAGYSLGVDGGVGYPIALAAGFVATPRASLTYTHGHERGYTETGAPGADLAVDAISQDLLQTSLGATLTRKIPFHGGSDDGTANSLTPEISVGWLHEVLNPRTTVVEAFDGVAGSSFSTSGAVPARDAAALGAWLTFRPGWSANAAIYARYDAALSRNETDQMVTAGLRLSW